MTAPTCPQPRSCPVPEPSGVALRRLRTVSLAEGARFFTAFSTADWPAVFNGSGRGDTRFAPFRDETGAVVPTVYGGNSETVALLETVFHNVHQTSGPRLIFRLDLAARGLVPLEIP